MSQIKQIFWFLLSLSILAALGWAIGHSKPRDHKGMKALVATIDATASKLKLQQFNAQGELIHSLTSPLMQHMSKDNVFLFYNPHILITQKGEPSWEIHSKRAKSLNGGERLVFLKQVIIHQKPLGKSKESTLKTEEITYFPKENRASTDKLVTYEQPGNFMQSIGMNAYLEEKKVELLHQARGSYAPSKG